MFNFFGANRKENNLYDEWQQKEIEEGEEKEINTLVYKRDELPAVCMKYAKEALIAGACPSSVSFLIDKLLASEINQEEYESYMKSSIYVPDVDDLIGIYDIDTVGRNRPTGKREDVLYGMALGDICGSAYEDLSDIDERKNLTVGNCIKPYSKCTDDTILSCATAEAMRIPMAENNKKELTDYRVESTYPFYINPFRDAYKNTVKEFPDAGYGSGFYRWAMEDKNEPYGSLGNGSAMRVVPIGAYFRGLYEVIERAIASACVTHNHPEGIKGAIIVGVSIWMALNGYYKDEIYENMKKHYKGIYGFEEFTLEECRYPNSPGKSDETCMFTVPCALICFNESEIFEDVINNALSINGDTDTIASIAGAIAGGYYGFPGEYTGIVDEKKPDEIFDRALTRLN